MRLRVRAALLCGLLVAGPAGAASDGALVLDGPLTQGALVRGHTAPGARVRFAGRELRVSPGGDFVIGFGRDAPARVRLELRLPDGESLVRELEVASRRYHVERIDGLPPSKVSPSPEELARIREESALIKAARQRDSALDAFLETFRWPLKGRISGVYGSQRILNGEPRRPHSGVDIAAPAGSEVRAPAGGVVSLAHPGMFFTGKTVMIDHGHGLSSIFAHLSRIRVKAGQRVRQGEVIGEVGATGRVTGPHLHWGLSLFGTRLDPALAAGAQ